MADDIEIPGFIPLPPNVVELGNLSAVTNIKTVNDLSADQIHDFMVPLMSKKLAYSETGNSIYAVEAFLLSMHAGFYPPMWVLSWLNNAFQDFYDSSSGRGIDKCLGLTSGKQVSAAYTAILRREIKQDLALEVWKLKTIFGISTENAAEMVVSWAWEDEKWNKTIHKLGKLDTDTIRQYYDREATKIYKEMPEEIVEKLRSYSDEEKEEYKKKFPIDKTV